MIVRKVNVSEYQVLPDSLTACAGPLRCAQPSG